MGEILDRVGASPCALYAMIKVGRGSSDDSTERLTLHQLHHLILDGKLPYGRDLVHHLAIRIRSWIDTGKVLESEARSDPYVDILINLSICVT